MKTYKTYILISLLLIISCAPNTNNTKNESDFQFEVKILDQNLNEPMEFDIFDNDEIIFIERSGYIKLYDPKIEKTKIITKFDVEMSSDTTNDKTPLEDGLLGIAIDPNYDLNNWIYLFYSPRGNIPKQHVSRFVFKNHRLDKKSEKILLEIPLQRDQCCHSAGSLEFGPNGNLFISVGDNTNPFDSDGFSPSDESKNRTAWDAQRSSSNTNNLTGKILRIKPENDGTYSIPDGNLFEVGTPNTKPEIYVMGNRNPFRISIDKKNNYLYWGEVGPDSHEDSNERGPRGYDEINQAKKPGYFGWPLFVADNKAYNDYSFEDQTSGPKFNSLDVINNSINNTGLKKLPDAQPAFIWYPYADSDEFPQVLSGPRNAMAGPVFYYEQENFSEKSIPKYYDGKLFIYDFEREWVFTVTMDESGDFVNMERFMENLDLNHPIDMLISKKGELYILEYGTTWYTQNKDAQIIKITKK